ncbi:MAG: transglycosylase SLT domain-containing protein [Candidatus Schekmanbacteria bacterium]|nr:transglycosylase SLT domain-containing protein [Candidatus Schekmanbacteria bacterium]
MTPRRLSEGRRRAALGFCPLVAVLVALASSPREGAGAGHEAVVSLAPAASGAAPAPQAPDRTAFWAALQKVRVGRASEALAELAAVSTNAGTTSDTKLHASMALGDLLVRLRRPAEAIAPLESAAATASPLQPYARLLLARALMRASVTPERVAVLVDELARGDPESLVTEEAQALLFAAHARKSDTAAAVDAGRAYLDRYPAGQWAHEARWEVAMAREKLGDHGAAHEALERIWFQTPDSPWAPEARARLLELRTRHGLGARVLTAAEHVAFVEALRASARHRQVLEEIETLRAHHPELPQLDRLLLLAASSAYDLGRNEAAINAADSLRTAFPRSPFAPAAALVAIKAARRDNDTDGVRGRCHVLASEHAGRREAGEALYQLATYLTNAGFENGSAAQGKKLIAESAAVYERILASTGSDAIVPDALWKYAWLEIRSGERAAGSRHLDELLARFPGSAYRGPALFWSGKLAQERGEKPLAIRTWQTLVGELPWGYYGHRAQELLALNGATPARIGTELVFPVPDPVDQPRGRLHYDLAVLLRGAGLFALAADELARDADSGTAPETRFALADLHAGAGEAARAARILQEAFEPFVYGGGKDVPAAFWRILYPLPDWELVQTESRTNGLDPWLVAALIRNESAFDPRARSPVGAVGLMQLMPEVASELAHKLGLAAPTESELYEPPLSIRLGTMHFADLLKRFANDPTSAICAYNAGAKPVARWKDGIRARDADEWMELVPFAATRLYVKRIWGDVREYRRIYATGAGS